MIEYTVTVCDNGDRFWVLNGELHREDGPAMENADGDRYWFLNGELHREDGPACEYANGNKYWFLNGKYHREDGPACEFSDGYKYWYLNGERLTEEEFLQMTQKHVIIIDGKDISVSEKSFNELKKSLSSH